MIEPSQLTIPTSFETERLLIRVPVLEDSAEINAATNESMPELKQWMVWAQQPMSLEESRENIRNAIQKFEKHEDMRLLVFLKETGELVASSGLHNPNWRVPSFEIGYWVRTKFSGNGYITEAVEGILAFAFEHLQARRVSIRVDELNERSWRVPERLGLRHEATLYNEERYHNGPLRHTRIYAQIKPDE